MFPVLRWGRFRQWRCCWQWRRSRPTPGPGKQPANRRRGSDFCVSWVSPVFFCKGRQRSNHRLQCVILSHYTSFPKKVQHFVHKSCGPSLCRAAVPFFCASWYNSRKRGYYTAFAQRLAVLAAPARQPPLDALLYLFAQRLPFLPPGRG